MTDMAALPRNALTTKELVDLWADAMPVLRDQGEADRMNELLKGLLDRLQRSGRDVPDMIFVSDEPPTGERAALLAGPDQIKPIWFSLAFARWDRSQVFKRFWASLSDEERARFFTEMPRT
jgi:hypothetical protein